MAGIFGRHAIASSRNLQVLSYAGVAVGVWLAWEIVKVPVVDRAPAGVAVRLAPASPEVLRKAAEAEFAAERYENAGVLAEESLSRAPFNARALRVRGLVEAQGENEQRADDLLTLAGNWSLRDDPAHAWLMERRLKRGDYGSSFAHADTLARRRADIHPQIFELFTVAAISDERSIPHLTRLLAASPPWREAYLNSLHARDDAAPTLAALAIGLQRSPKPFTDSELGHLYRTWTAAGRLAGVRFLRRELNRPPLAQPLQNGDFIEEAVPDTVPFQWRMGTAPGIVVQITEDDLGTHGRSLRVEYDGRRQGIFAEQLMLLEPGLRTVSGLTRSEGAAEVARMRWTVTCADTGTIIASRSIVGSAASDATWRSWSLPVTIPAANCTAQWLRLETLPADRSAPMAAWFDDVRLN